MPANFLSKNLNRLLGYLGLFLVLVLGIYLICCIVFALSRKLPAVKQTSDIEVRAMVGVPAENKLGGIQFAVSDAWGYDRVVFNVRGFNEGLKLDDVICYRDGCEVDHFNQWKSCWDIWLARYQGVLIVATVGEKNAELFK